MTKILSEFGDPMARADHSRFSGLLMVTTSLDAFHTVAKIRAKILDEPWSIRYCHRFIPVQESTRASISEIIAAVARHLELLQPEDTYRITVEKRGSDLSTKDLVEAVADTISNKVSLEGFDWNIVIEILGDIAGVSILRSGDIVSTMKVKRDSSD